MHKELFKGNIAIAAAALNCGCECYFGYPITPQTEIGEYLSHEMPKRDLAYVCAESEIGAINMALGAASTGAKVMSSSSSCAVALMQEALSYAASDELPIVLVNVMRAGPGQGYIYPSQGDYNQAVVGGGNGDYKTIVLAPTSVQECIDFTYRAFYLAHLYRNPTILLLDGLLGQMTEPAVLSKNPYMDIDNSSWVLSGAKNRTSRKIHSLEADSEKLSQHVKKMQTKYSLIEKKEVVYEEYFCNDAEYIIVAFGSLARIAKDVVDFYRRNGIKFGVFIPKTLFPFPYEKLNELSNKNKVVYVAEMNSGQMLKDVQLCCAKNTKVEFIGRPAGEWLNKKEMIGLINNNLEECYAKSI